MTERSRLVIKKMVRAPAPTPTPIPTCDMQQMEGALYLESVASNSVHLVLTDPPYIISRESGMNTQHRQVAENAANNVMFSKSEAEWTAYKTGAGIESDDAKERYMKYGSVYGKKYCVQTDYGAWDSEFTMAALDAFVAEYFRVLRPGGTAIIFFDLWKLSYLKEMMEAHGFKQIRMIEWIKTNPQPLNSAVNYLTNCREIALTGVKRGKPTFHGKYDAGIYHFPLQGGKNRFHPTQKSLALFEALIAKHSNPGDVVLDTFLGSGTTALAARRTGRAFLGCERCGEYFARAVEIVRGGVI